MKKRIVIVKAFAVDEKGNPIEYLAYEVPAPRKLLTDRLHHLLIRLHWRARISTPSGTRGAVDVRRRPPRKMASSRSWLSSRIVESVADAGSLGGLAASLFLNIWPICAKNSICPEPSNC